MSSDEQSEKECPLCMEPLEIDDVNFYPCKCEYQICRFCWHRLRTDENGLCPACRQPYPEDPVNFKPLTASDVQKIKSEKKQKQKQQRIITSESRKHLSSYRVLQKNLVYVVGLSARVADAEVLKKPEYFGKYGRIVKVAVGSSSSTLNGPQSASCTAYVTYARFEDALRAIQAVNNAQLDGRLVKASLGTTKYCSSFLRGQTCHKTECMYLHDVADTEVSFTKDDMHLGRHAEYEKKLIETTLLKEKGQRERAAAVTNPRRKHSQSKSGDRGGSLPVVSSGNSLEKAHTKTTAAQSRPHERPVGKLREHTSQNRERVTNENVNVNGEVSVDINKAVNGNSVDSENRKPDVTHRPAKILCDEMHSERPQSKCEEPRTICEEEPTDGVKSRLLQWKSSDVALTDDASDSGTTKISCAKSPDSSSESKAEMSEENSKQPRSDAGASVTCDWQSVLGIVGNGRHYDGPFDTVSTEQVSAADPQILRHRPSRLSVHSDDDLGFDPFSESAKGLADLLEEEKLNPQQRISLNNMPMSSVTSSLMSLGLQCGWRSMGNNCAEASFANTVEQPRANYYSSALLPLEIDYLAPTALRNLAAGQPSQHSVYAPPPQSPLSFGMPTCKPQSANVHFPDPPPGLSSVYSQQRYPLLSTALPMAPVNQSPPPPPDASQLNEWQEGLKALLPNVNVRFVSDISSAGYPSSRSSISSSGSWQTPSQQQLPLLNCYGQAATQSQTMAPTLSTPLSMLSFNSLSQPVPQWMPPPPGFTPLSKR